VLNVEAKLTGVFDDRDHERHCGDRNYIHEWGGAPHSHTQWLPRTRRWSLRNNQRARYDITQLCHEEGAGTVCSSGMFAFAIEFAGV